MNRMTSEQLTAFKNAREVVDFEVHVRLLATGAEIDHEQGLDPHYTEADHARLNHLAGEFERGEHWVPTPCPEGRDPLAWLEADMQVHQITGATPEQLQAERERIYAHVLAENVLNHLAGGLPLWRPAGGPR